MSIADTCEESAFEHGRSMALESFTKKELVEELCKRGGVRMLELAKNEPYYIASKERHCIFGDNAKQILVVTE